MHTLSDKAAAKTLVTWMIIGSVVLVVLGFVCGCAMPPREQKRLDPDKWVLRTGHVLTRSFIEDDDGPWGTGVVGRRSSTAGPGP